MSVSSKAPPQCIGSQSWPWSSSSRAYLAVGGTLSVHKSPKLALLPLPSHLRTAPDQYCQTELPRS